MSSAHDHDGTHEAIEHFIREGIGLGIQLAGHYKRQHHLHAQQTLRASRDDRLHQLIQSIPPRDSMDKAVVSTRWQRVHHEDWWQQHLATRHGPAKILATYTDALTYTDTDQNARQAVDAMNARFTQPPFNLNINELATDGSLGRVPDEEAADTHREPLGNPLAQQHTALGDLPVALDEPQHPAMDARSAETIARLNDLQLSQALTTVGSPLTAADAVTAAANENAAPAARPERNAANAGRPLDQGR